MNPESNSANNNSALNVGETSLDDCSDIINKVSLRILPFLFLLYILSYLDRINVSFAGLEMNAELGFTASVFGLGSGIFFLGYFLFGIPSNLMIAKIGARRWIAAIMVVWGAISVSMAATSGATMFFVMRFVLGVAEAGFFPGIILYLTYWYPKKLHGGAVARFMSAIPVAGILGGVISAKILALKGLLGLSGWKWLFIVTGMPSVLLGIVVWFYLADGPMSASWLSAEERRRLLSMLKRERSAAIATKYNTSSTEQNDNVQIEKGPDKPQSKPRVVAVLLNRNVWHFALMYFCLTLGMYGFQLWLPQIISGFGGLTPEQTGMLSTIPAGFQAIGMLIIARSSDRSGERKLHAAGAATLAAMSLVVGAVMHEKLLALAALSIAAAGIWGTVGPFWAMPTAILEASDAAAAIALINSVGNLGGFVGPSIIGFIKTSTSNFTYALYAMAASLMVAAFLAISAPRPRDEQTKK